MKYLGHKATEDFWHCNLWEWAVDMVVNPLLAPYFVWDACELSKFNGEEFVRFIHEPWTANRLWEVQVCQYFLFQLWFAYSSAVQTARSGRETIWVHPLCRPDKVVLIWFSEGVPYCGALCQPAF